jgi:hypothetical protein
LGSFGGLKPTFPADATAPDGLKDGLENAGGIGAVACLSGVVCDESQAAGRTDGAPWLPETGLKSEARSDPRESLTVSHGRPSVLADGALAEA